MEGHNICPCWSRPGCTLYQTSGAETGDVGRFQSTAAILTESRRQRAVGRRFTYGGGLSLRTHGLGHLSQDLVPIAGRVSSGFYFLLSYFLAVNVESDPGGGNQDVELWQEKEEENRNLVNVFVVRPTVVSAFDLTACR